MQAWIEFAENNNDGLPEFPLPLGNPLEPTSSDMASEILMDAAQTERFEAACTAAGARFVGGLFACLGLVEHEFTGAANLLRAHSAGFPHGRGQLHDAGLVHRPDPDHRADRGDVLQRGRVGGAGLLRFGSEHGAGCRITACWNWRRG